MTHFLHSLENKLITYKFPKVEQDFITVAAFESQIK